MSPLKDRILLAISSSLSFVNFIYLFTSGYAGSCLTTGPAGKPSPFFTFSVLGHLENALGVFSVCLLVFLPSSTSLFLFLDNNSVHCRWLQGLLFCRVWLRFWGTSVKMWEWLVLSTDTDFPLGAHGGHSNTLRITAEAEEDFLGKSQYKGTTPLQSVPWKATSPENLPSKKVRKRLRQRSRRHFCTE